MGGAGHGISHPGGDFVLDVGRCGVDDLPRRNPVSAPISPENSRTPVKLERAECVAGLGAGSGRVRVEADVRGMDPAGAVAGAVPGGDLGANGGVGGGEDDAGGTGAGMVEAVVRGKP